MISYYCSNNEIAIILLFAAGDWGWGGCIIIGTASIFSWYVDCPDYP
jgi:hypothetical protein